MAETDPVRIVVEIVDQFSDELKELREELERLDQKDLDIDFEIEEGAEIESVRAQLEAIQDRIETEHDIDTDGFAEALAKIEALQAASSGTDIDVDVDSDSFPQIEQGIPDEVGPSMERMFGDAPLEDIGANMRDMDPAPQDFSRRIQESINSAADFETEPDMRFGDEMGAQLGSPDFRAMMENRDAMLGTDMLPSTDMRTMFPDGQAGGPSRFQKFAGKVQRTADSFDNLGKKLLQYRPSIMDWWNILALLIPIIVTMIGLVIGLAAALVAVGAAAATIVGIGLLGWGDSLTQSFQNAQQEAMQLARTLFDVVQPAASAFQPITEDFMQATPGAVADLVDDMQRLTVFQDELGSMGGGLVDWLEEGIQAGAALDEQIGQILTRFGAAIGNTLIKTLQTMVTEVYKNQNAYVDLGKILLDSIVIIFNLMKVVGFTVSQFSVLFDILVVLSAMLSNEIVVAFLTVVTAVVLFETAVASAVSAMNLLLAANLRNWAAQNLQYITAMIKRLWAFVTAAQGAQMAIRGLAAATGIGLLFLGAGALAQGAVDSMSGPGRRGRFAQSGGNTYINVQGDVRRQEMDRLLDKVPQETRGEMSMNSTMEGT
jgi:hypothetical protein